MGAFQNWILSEAEKVILKPQKGDFVVIGAEKVRSGIYPEEDLTWYRISTRDVHGDYYADKMMGPSNAAKTIKLDMSKIVDITSKVKAPMPGAKVYLFSKSEKQIGRTERKEARQQKAQEKRLEAIRKQDEEQEKQNQELKRIFNIKPSSSADTGLASASERLKYIAASRLFGDRGEYTPEEIEQLKKQAAKEEKQKQSSRPSQEPGTLTPKQQFELLFAKD